ncbi:MAG: hypothetical protein SFV15_01315 [Polyangiaceae bacterium]|nr:hypothetical protein [Polyangiaceae bacterium]
MLHRSLLVRPNAVLLTTLALSGALLSGRASAQTAEEISGARAAATEGAKAFNEGRYADAVDMMSRAESIVHSPVQQLYLARSYAKLGKLVKARELYLKIRREGMSADASEAVRRAVADAEKDLQVLEPRLPYITAAAQGAGPLPVTVTMDGVAIPQALLGVPHPIDPGKHVFQAFAEGKRSQEKIINVAEAARETVVLDLQTQPGATAVPPPVATSPGTAPAPSDTTGNGAAVSMTSPGGDTGTTPKGGGTSSLRIGSYVAFGVGAVGLGVGTFFLLDGSGKTSDSNKLFDDNQCGASPKGAACNSDVQQQITSLDSDAASAKTLGAVGIVAGVLGVGAGVTLFVLSSESDSGSSARTVAPYVGFNSVGVTGTF